MSRVTFLAASTLLALGALHVSAQSAHAAPAPAIPAMPAQAPVVPGLSPTIIDALARGLVVVERDKKPVAVGTVLRGDGRVVTALSSLGSLALAQTADGKTQEPVIDLRFPDGSVAHAKLGHQDTAWDLALLVPQSGKYNDGLVASETDPTAVPVYTAMPSRAKLPLVSNVPVRGRTEARARQDATTLPAALDLDVHSLHVVPGAPIVDNTGSVVGILVNACKAGSSPCTPVSVGVPVAALRNFLMRVPESAKRPAAWLGIAGSIAQAAGTKGVRVMAVSPNSPASNAGFHVSEADGDIIVAVDGTPVDSPEALAAEVAKHAVGESVKVLTVSAGKYREVPVALSAAPLRL